MRSRCFLAHEEDDTQDDAKHDYDAEDGSEHDECDLEWLLVRVARQADSLAF